MILIKFLVVRNKNSLTNHLFTFTYILFSKANISFIRIIFF